jgi:phosphatidate cytidylyltransferase
MIVQELFTFARKADGGKSMPLFRTQQWYFFAVACFYLYGRFVRKNFTMSAIVLGESLGGRKGFVAWLLSRHLMISYTLYTAGASLEVPIVGREIWC